MHPDDVAERVAEEVELLRARLAASPELRAGEPQLRGPFELFVPFRARRYRRAYLVNVPTRVSCGKCGTLLRPVVARADPIERDLLLVCDCSGYDAQPITAELRLADGSPLDRWPHGSPLEAPAIIYGHPDYDRPFVCRRGLREFHTHPQHEDNPWDRHRESIRIHDIIPELLGDLQRRWVFE